MDSDEGAFREELKTRKRIYEIYTKEQSDFETQAEYDDYLEMREDVVFALISGHDLDKVESQIAQYKQENQESILRHRRRKLEEANASFTSSLDKMRVETSSEVLENGKGLRGPQPQPLKSGHALTGEGSLKVWQRARTSSEWHMMARTAGWSRHFYYDFVKKHALENICRPNSKE